MVVNNEGGFSLSAQCALPFVIMMWMKSERLPGPQMPVESSECVSAAHDLRSLFGVVQFGSLVRVFEVSD